jgi:adenine specific DNA methylase Mod
VHDLIVWNHPIGIRTDSFTPASMYSLVLRKQGRVRFNREAEVDAPDDQTLPPDAFTDPLQKLTQRGDNFLATNVWRFPPTGKNFGEAPEKLFRRIIRASSNPDDLVIIPFLGSGTAALAAQKLRRRWIAIDANPDVITRTEERLRLFEAGMTPVITE